jgi:drug/metabolite transporter (DMT)-like permease
VDRELLIAVLAGLGGMVGWGLADFFAKKTIDQIGDIVTLAWAHIFGTLAFVLVALYQQFMRGQPVAIPSDVETWALLIFFGILQAAVYLLVYNGFGKGQVALLNPIFASFSGLTAVLSIAAFGEAVTTYRVLTLGIIFVGILLVSIDVEWLRAKRFSLAHIPGLKEVALATVLAAFWTIFWKQFIGGKDWLSYALFMYAFMTIAVLVVAKVRRIPLAVGKPGLWGFLILIGLCETGAYLAISLGYSETSLTSVVALLSGAFSVPTIILARAFLKERTTLVQTVGTLTIVLGIILLPLQ